MDNRPRYLFDIAFLAALAAILSVYGPALKLSCDAAGHLHSQAEPPQSQASNAAKCIAKSFRRAPAHSFEEEAAARLAPLEEHRFCSSARKTASLRRHLDFAQESAQAMQSPQIRLDAPTRVYRPGDTITGTLELPADLNTLPTLVLQGIVKSATVFEYSGTCKGLTLVVWERIAFRESETQDSTDPPICKTFRFSTTIPLDSSVPSSAPVPKGQKSKYWDYPWSWEGDNRFINYDSVSSPLPPTCKFGPHGTRTVSDCLVEYAVLALDVRSGVTWAVLATAGIWLVSLPVTLDTASDIDDPMHILHDDKRIQFTSDNLARKDSPRLSTLQRIRSGSLASSTPQAAFSIKLIRPRVLRAGSPLQIWVEVTPQDTDAVRFARAAGKTKMPKVLLAEMPNVELKEAKFELTHVTTTRTRGRISDNDDRWEEVLLTLTEPPKPKEKAGQDKDADQTSVVQWNASDLLASQQTSGVSPLWLQKADQRNQSPAESVNLNRKVSFQIAVPDRLAPTFRTYNISRRYKWKLCLSFECAGQVQKIYYNFLDLTVLPPKVSDDTTIDDFLDWGEYSLETERQTMLRLAVSSGLEVAGLGMQIAQTVLSFV